MDFTMCLFAWTSYTVGIGWLYVLVKKTPFICKVIVFHVVLSGWVAENDGSS